MKIIINMKKICCILTLLIVSCLYMGCSKKEEQVVEEVKIEKSNQVSDEEFAPYKDIKLYIIGDSLIKSCEEDLKNAFTNCTIDTSCNDTKKSEAAYTALKEAGADYDVLIYAVGGNAQEDFNTDVQQLICKTSNGKKVIFVSACMPFKGQARNRDRKVKELIKDYNGCYFLDLRDIEKVCPEKIDYENRVLSKEAADEFVKYVKYIIYNAYKA